MEEKYEEFNVHLNYKSQLKSFQKKQFDPFCRRQRINFYYTKDKHFVTTVGQLNFFKWAIENNIIDYIENNYSDIEKDMNNNNSLYRIKYNNITRKKRQELSLSASKCIKKETIEITISFN